MKVSPHVRVFTVDELQQYLPWQSNGWAAQHPVEVVFSTFADPDMLYLVMPALTSAYMIIVRETTWQQLTERVRKTIPTLVTWLAEQGD